MPPIDFQARDGLLFADGEPFYVKGAAWFGSENRAAPPLGLDKHPMAWYYDFLRRHDFNAVRFLFNHQMILEGTRLDPPNEAVYGVGAPWESPELAHLGYLEAFVRLAEAAAEKGVLVMLGCHRLRPSAWPGNGLWYDDHMSEADVLRSWELIATTLCDQWVWDRDSSPHIFLPSRARTPVADEHLLNPCLYLMYVCSELLTECLHGRPCQRATQVLMGQGRPR